ncbi:unnamed protein product [Cylicostephanus goldi]|uniref:Apple domain-containing protein n=1 Tax=Cylicostephanus goldi TaxID=71465 RepID=A0A3P6SAW6_CYLGO|nr:unnamed protein product [Cylicostephanus goldi]
MSYVTLLYLFYLTSASSDVDSPSESPTIWQCYAENSICGSYIKDSPSLRNNCALTAEDLPSERPVLIDSLVSKILSSQANVSYGLLIFEAGNDAYVKWQLSTPSSLSVDLAYESVPPLVQESFVRDLAIYHFSAAAYNGAPAEVLLVAPGASLSVSRKKTGEESSTASSCRHAALVAAPVKWTAVVAAEFAQRVNRIVVSVCKVRKPSVH